MTKLSLTISTNTPKGVIVDDVSVAVEYLQQYFHNLADSGDGTEFLINMPISEKNVRISQDDDVTLPPVFQRNSYFEIEYNNFDSLVGVVLGIDYECVPENEWNNDSCYDIEVTPMDVDENSFFMKFTKDEVETIIQGGVPESMVSAGDLLEYMAWKKMIPFGKYLIKVSW